MPTELPVDPALRRILESSDIDMMRADGEGGFKALPVKALFPTDDEAAAMKEFALTTPAEPGTPPHYDREKIIGVYFTASWCPPCRKFTPMLKRAFNTIRNDQGKDFEVVVASWDREEPQYNDYVGGMTDFTALPFKDPRVDELCRAYGVSSIPQLVLVRARDNKVINREAKDYLPHDPACRTYPWPPLKNSWVLNMLLFGGTMTMAGLGCIILRDKRILRPKA